MTPTLQDYEWVLLIAVALVLANLLAKPSFAPRWRSEMGKALEQDSVDFGM